MTVSLNFNNIADALRLHNVQYPVKLPENFANAVERTMNILNADLALISIDRAEMSSQQC